MSNLQSITDSDLVDARDNWSSDQWDRHFTIHKVRAAGRARYDRSGENDVLKVVLLHVQGRRCWFGGSSTCESRALLARDAQIDHVIPQSSTPSSMRAAIGTSSFQRDYYDVHDPGNLAIICGPCNQEKSSWGNAHHLRKERIEQSRVEVITRVNSWYRNAALDDAAVRALAGANLSEDSTREIYEEIAVTMVENLAAFAGNAQRIRDFQEVEVETEWFHLSARPSDAVIEAEVESRAEMEADDRRHGI